ncbi:MAG: peptidoglycan-binding protein [Oscillospiraceae bacterium]|nr:peptidoglycan-binding protein [Oscillospiraceae bacterium]
MTIKQKQWQLYYLGYYGGEIDGIWGTLSKAAAVRFQKDYDLDADGIFGALTIAKSIEIIKSIQKEITDGKIAIDGLAGQEIKDATAQWQRKTGLTPDGIAGAMTRGKILKLPAQETDDWWNSIRYFSRKEFACKCGRYCDGYPAQMQRGVVELADRARAELKGVGFVSSGLRCSQHNANVGGVSDNRHLNGKAVDLRIEGKSAGQTLAWAQRQPEVRYAYAIDANFIHMDIE